MLALQLLNPRSLRGKNKETSDQKRTSAALVAEVQVEDGLGIC